MQTANNTNNYTVEGLVAKYRNFVAENTPKSWEDDGTESFLMPISVVDSSSDQQLIVTLYKLVAGDNADKNILDAVSDYEQHFYKDALTAKELEFLSEHFSEVIAYEFADSGKWVWSNIFASYAISERYKQLIQERVQISEGMTVYIPNAGYGDLAVLFKGCNVKGYTSHLYNPFNEEEKIESRSEDWALGQIRLYAAGIKSEIVPFYNLEQLELEHNSIDVIVSDFSHYEIWNLEELYPLLKEGGKMYIFSEKDDLADYANFDKFQYKKVQNLLQNPNTAIDTEQRKRFFNMIVEEKAICSIISYQDKGYSKDEKDDNVLLIVEKKGHSKVIVENLDKEKTAEVNASDLEADLLWPDYYMSNRPVNGVPLSSLVKLFNIQDEVVEQFHNRKNSEIAFPEHLEVLMPKNFGSDFAEANLCVRDFKKVSDPMFEEWGARLIHIYHPGVCLYGNAKKQVVGYINEDPSDKYLCIDIVPYLIPQNDVDVRYIAALLLSQEVKQQILSICDGKTNTKTMSLILDKIIVPDHTPKERMEFLADVTYKAMNSTQEELKKNHNDYKKAVRMRKHALTQSLSSIEAMFYALNAYRNRQDGKLSNDDVISRRKMTTVKDAFEFIGPKLKNMMYTLEKIADVEYSFDNASWINPEQFIEDYIAQSESGWLNFKPVITWKKGDNLLKQDIIDPFTKEVVASKGAPKSELFFSKDALKHILNNVVANAVSHGFTDANRSDYQLRFSWHEEGTSLVVEIENNGTPIPSDRDTASLLEYGVSGALHKDGHNGIGCNEIDDIMRRYDGKVEIVSTPDNEFTVKYILTFKSNILYSL